MKAGPYELTDKIGQGGMGTVWRGRSPKGDVVAVKLIPRWSSNDARTRFERERRLLATLGSGEGFVPLLDAGDGASGPYLVMPFLGGGTLRDRLSKGALSIEETVALGRALANALGRAHASGIVHRDLKPENVLYSSEGKPLVADLGLGKHFRTDTPGASQSVALSQAGSSRGTLGYMAPEQAGSAEKAGPPADVFALGAILYECLAGEGPFAASSAMASLARVHQRGQTPLSKVRRETPAWLERAIDRALDPDPAKRFAGGDELAQALEAGDASSEKPRRSLALPVALAALVTIVVAVVAVALTRKDPAPRKPDPSPSPVARASPRPSLAPSPTTPAWFLALPASERPPLPLPEGIRFGARPGEYVNARDGSVLVFVPGGVFLMGSADTDQEPVHEVELSPYFLGKLEVTVRQFAAFVQATSYVTYPERTGDALITEEQLIEFVGKPGATWRTPQGDGKPAEPDLPVVTVTWADAGVYATWAGASLPTEAQWERAAGWDARTKSARRFAWGNEVLGKGSPRVANVADESLRPWRPLSLMFFDGYEDGFLRLAPVGSFPAGASPTGALDMTGNASELCRDTWSPDFLGRSPRKDPCCLEDGVKVVERGGNWADAPAVCRVTHHNDIGRLHAEDRLGFRIVVQR